MKKKNNIADLLGNTSFRSWLKKEKGADNARWEAWQKESTENEQLLSDISMMEKGIPFKKQKVDKTAMKAGWDKLAQQLEEQNTVKTTANRQIQPRRNWLKIAASIAILAIAAFGMHTYLNQAALIEYHTNFAEHQKITLPEGTEVTLGANSHLSYFDNFVTSTNRKVVLDGEAYFKVAKQPTGTQFIVKTKDIEVQVVGTAFNVNTHRAASIISLTEGKVNLAKEGYQNQALIAGQTAQFNTQTNQFDLLANRTDYWSTWRFQKWSFGDSTPMKEVIQRIEETFGLEIHLEDAAILDKEASGDVEIDNQKVLFESLSYLLDVDFQINGTELIIKNKE